MMGNKYKLQPVVQAGPEVRNLEKPHLGRRVELAGGFQGSPVRQEMKPDLGWGGRG